MLADCADICADFPWVREAWLLPPPPGGDDPEADVIVVCDRPPRSVETGQRKRLVGQLQARSDLRLALRLVTAGQLSRWLAGRGRFAAAFRNAVRLCPQEEG